MASPLERAPTRRLRAVAKPTAPEPSPDLPAWKAFLVQLSTEASSSSAVFRGRIEHLNTGKRLRFASRQELLAGLAQFLRTIDDPGPRRRR